VSLKSRLDRIEAELVKRTGDTAMMEEFAPWLTWWTPRIGAFPPPFPPEMPERVRQHFVTLVLMDLTTAGRPLAKIPPHVQAYLPADLVAHLRQQFPTDAELTAVSDEEWTESRRGYTAPHFLELSKRRLALRAAGTT